MVMNASDLLALHVPGNPLVLVNAWDVASACEVEAAGSAAVATSSAAFAASMGAADANTMPVDTVFDFVRRVVDAVHVPVTVDLEGGYGLAPVDLVGRLVDAGAVGCNLEDSDHAAGGLLDPQRHAAYLAEVRAAAGDGVVVNARVDTLIRQPGDGALDDVVRRAKLYLEAGADCVYPIGLFDPTVVRDVVAAVDAPVNANLHPTTTVGALAGAGAARISIGPSAFRTLMAELRRSTEATLEWRVG